TPSLKYCFSRHDLYVQDNCGLTPRVTTLVRNRPGVRGVNLRSKMRTTWSGRPRSRWSRITRSKKARPAWGWSNTRVAETAKGRKAKSYAEPACTSAVEKRDGS